MCWVQVVPDFGYEQMNISDDRRGSDLHLSIVWGDDIGSSGIGGNDIDMGFAWFHKSKPGLYEEVTRPSLSLHLIKARDH